MLTVRAGVTAGDRSWRLAATASNTCLSMMGAIETLPIRCRLTVAHAPVVTPYTPRGGVLVPSVVPCDFAVAAPRFIQNVGVPVRSDVLDR